MKLATYNCRGLSNDLKQSVLAADLKRYQVDICSLQETKLIGIEASNVSFEDYNFYFLENSDIWHGLGFAVRKTLSTTINTKLVTNRIAILQLDIGDEKGNSITIINVHAPTALHEKERDVFFENLQKVVDKYKSESLMYIAGDFNSKVGRKGDAEMSVGSHVKQQKRNAAGQKLVDFGETNRMILCNTIFKHKECHKATWTAKQTKGRIIQNQIDFIMCSIRLKKMLKDARSFGGMKHSSDHKIVISTIILDRKYTMNIRRKRTDQRISIDSNKLVNNEKIRTAYIYEMKEKLNQINPSSGDGWNKTVDIMIKIGKEMLRKEKKKSFNVRYNDQILADLRNKETFE